MSALLLLVLALYLVWALLLFFGQRRILYLSGGLTELPHVVRTLPGLRAYRLELPGGEVDAWFLPPVGGGARPALLFTHGNAELIDHWAFDMASFAREGVGVMLVEYPGYGRSTGMPSSTTLRAAVLAAYDTLAAQPEVDATRIVAYGRSVGGGPAAVLSLERPLAGLVLQSSFTTLRAFARRYLLPGLLVRDRFEVLDAVRAFAGPVLVIHGERDDVIPFRQGEALAAAASDATLLRYDCAHNDCPPVWEPHVERVLSFLREKQILD